MRNKVLTLTLSILAIVICLSLITMGTYALFSETITVENHLQAGNLDAKLERTNLEAKSLGADGYLETITNNQLVDFSSTTSMTDNVFGLENNELVAPGSSYEATMKISNNGTVAFGYWIEINLKDAIPSELASQIKVIVTTYDENGDEVIEEVYLSNGLSVGDANNYLGKLAVNASENFKVKVLFEDLTNNNDAQNDEVNFDLVVYAVQVLEK